MYSTIGSKVEARIIELAGDDAKNIYLIDFIERFISSAFKERVSKISMRTMS